MPLENMQVVNMSVATHLLRAAKLHENRIAAICDDEQLTYKQVNDRSDQLAHALLAQGLMRGDRVGTLMENSLRCVEVDFALAKAGLVRASVNPRLPANDGEYILKDSGAKALIHDAEFESKVAEMLPQLPLIKTRVRTSGSAGNDAHAYEPFLASGALSTPDVSVDPEDLYCLLYTSGTTGRPKGVMLSHRSFIQVVNNFRIELGPHDVGQKILLMQSMTHGACLFLLASWMTGGTGIIMRHFDATEALRLAAVHEIDSIKLIPTMLQRILRLPDIDSVQLPHLKQIIYGASPMPTDTLNRAIEIFGDEILVQIYGQSEAPATISVLPASEHRRDNPNPERLSSSGRAWATVALRVVDEIGQEVPVGEPGELQVQAPQIMSGYWKRPDLTEGVTSDGWLSTKDMARLDSAGYVYLLGRKDEMIISGGYNIAPREIEEELHNHPAILDAAVVGERDPDWGQVVVAYVVLKESSVSAAELISAVKPVLGYKRPKRIYVLDEMPKNATGKIQKKSLSPRLTTPGRATS